MSKLDIPNSWATSTLGECVEIVGGATPDSTNARLFAVPGEGIPWVTPADLGKQKEKYISSGSRDITEAGFNSCSTQLLPKDSILFSSRAPIGHVAISANPICTNQGFKSIKASQFFSSHFLYFYLIHSKDEIASMGSGTTFKEVFGSVMKLVELVVPPLGEQKRIASKIDSTQSKISEIESCANMAEKLIGKYREALLQKAFRGELVPQNPDDESASELIKQIRSERIKQSDGKKRKQDELSKITQEEIPFEIPESWEWVRLVEISKKIVDGTHHTPKYMDSGIHFISAKDINHSRVSFSGTRFISEKEHAQLIGRCFPEAGDVLCTKSGTIGRTAVVEAGSPPFSLFESVALVKPANGIDSNYLELAVAFYVNSHAGTGKIKGAAVKHLHLEDLREALIPLPPAREQMRIIQSMRESMAQVSATQLKLRELSNYCALAKTAILDAAFKGKLVLQISGEGSGHDLLSGIRSSLSVRPEKSEKKTNLRNKKTLKRKSK